MNKNNIPSVVFFNLIYPFYFSYVNEGTNDWQIFVLLLMFYIIIFDICLTWLGYPVVCTQFSSSTRWIDLWLVCQGPPSFRRFFSPVLHAERSSVRQRVGYIWGLFVRALLRFFAFFLPFSTQKERKERSSGQIDRCCFCIYWLSWVLLLFFSVLVEPRLVP